MAYKGRMKFGNKTRNERYRLLLNAEGGDTPPEPDSFGSVIYLYNGTLGTNNDTTWDDVITGQSFTMYSGAALDDDITPPVDAPVFQLYDGTEISACDANQTSWRVGSDDFSIEAWYYCNHTPQSANGPVAGYWANSNQSYGLQHTANEPNGTFSFIHSTDGTTIVNTQWDYPDNIAAGVWRHLAACRDGDNLYAYINGVSLGDPLDLTGVTMFDGANVNNMQMGNRPGAALNGGVGPVRIIKGEAIYPGGTTFTVPTAIFPEA